MGPTPNYLFQPTTTGLFTAGGRAYGLQQDHRWKFQYNRVRGITDRRLYTIELVPWRDGPVTTAPFAGGGPFSNAFQNPQAVLADLQTCQTAFLTTANPGANTGQYNDKGFRWAESVGGFTLFNTIVPPTSSQYTFSYCDLGTVHNTAADGHYQNANSLHPGGANFLFADGSVRFIKSSINVLTYWGLGTVGRRRGYLVR